MGNLFGIVKPQRGLRRTALSWDVRDPKTGSKTEAAGLSRRTALRDLQELMHRGLIVREGSRKAAVYRLR